MVSRNGKHNGKQRYICKSCKKTFSDFTTSVISCSKKPLDRWVQYAKSMIRGDSIRKSAKDVGINIATSFFWRHKLLDALREYVKIGHVDGVIEADETFFRESFKGNHSKSKTFVMPRKPYKNGQKANKRGISSEQVCVGVAKDRTGNVVADIICKGRMTAKKLEKFYANSLEPQSILCTDSHKSYIRFTKNFKLEHIRIKPKKHKEGIYHINNANSYHKEMKEWFIRFHGVATKYLNNNLYFLNGSNVLRMKQP